MQEDLVERHREALRVIDAPPTPNELSGRGARWPGPGPSTAPPGPRHHASTSARRTTTATADPDETSCTTASAYLQERAIDALAGEL